MLTNERTYSELILIPTFEERFDYLKLHGQIGLETFGTGRYLNQWFYTSKEWREFRRKIILRDEGKDLGILELGDVKELTVHHLNPITQEDVIKRNLDKLLNPENAITVRTSTHKAIHYGDSRFLLFKINERAPNDTIPWKG